MILHAKTQDNGLPLASGTEFPGRKRPDNLATRRWSGQWELVTYVCGCAGSSPRVTLFPWISLKHFSQK